MPNDITIRAHVITVGVNRRFLYILATAGSVSIVTFATVNTTEWSVSIASLFIYYLVLQKIILSFGIIKFTIAFG